MRKKRTLIISGIVLCSALGFLARYQFLKQYPLFAACRKLSSGMSEEEVKKIVRSFSDPSTYSVSYSIQNSVIHCTLWHSYREYGDTRKMPFRLDYYDHEENLTTCFAYGKLVPVHTNYDVRITTTWTYTDLHRTEQTFQRTQTFHNINCN